MVQLIVGRKGKGKTKHLLDKVNTEVKDIAGNVVYLDKSTKHMFELNNKIRLINVSDYMINSSDEFVGFICGIISQDHDLQQMYFDSFLKIACMEDSAADSEKVNAVIGKLEAVSTKFNVDFVLSISLDAHELSEDLKSKVIVSL
ncbi:MAG: twitching motility protein PilT [Lachnospiraceae bacterium]|nr:twitching motility protein PilT [Lachnospiraceae bacterium]